MTAHRELKQAVDASFKKGDAALKPAGDRRLKAQTTMVRRCHILQDLPLRSVSSPPLSLALPSHLPHTSHAHLTPTLPPRPSPLAPPSQLPGAMKRQGTVSLAKKKAVKDHMLSPEEMRERLRALRSCCVRVAKCEAGEDNEGGPCGAQNMVNPQRRWRQVRWRGV